MSGTAGISRLQAGEEVKLQSAHVTTSGRPPNNALDLAVREG